MRVAASVVFVALLFVAATEPPLGGSLPPQVVLDRVAPEKCLFYVSSAGLPKPDAKSTNHTLQLMANKEVQACFEEIKAQATELLQRGAEQSVELAQGLNAGLLPLSNLALTHPVAFYVERFDVLADGSPDVAAALVVHCGDRTEEIRQTVDNVVALALAGSDLAVAEVDVSGVTLHRVEDESIRIDWGFREDYFLLTLGEKTSSDVLARLADPKTSPRWLVALRERAKVPRAGIIAYLNAAAIRETIEPKIKDPNLRATIPLLGLDRLTAAGSITGLDDQGVVTRQFVDVDHWPDGWSLTAPLTAADLRPVPDNADLASISRFNAGAAYRFVIESLNGLNPAEEIDKKIGQVEQQLGFQIEQDLFASLGDVWTVHSAAGGGLLPFSGLVATVTVRDEQKLAKVQDTLLKLGRALLSQQASPPFAIETKNVRDVTVYHVQANGPVGWDPSWAVFDGRLVVTATLQGMRFHIARGGKKSLAEVPAVAKTLESAPIVLSYQDTKTAIRQAFAAVQTVGPMFVGQLASQGIHVDLPTLPELDSIEEHILPRIDVVRQTPQGIEVDGFATVPFVASGGGSPATAGFLVALLLPAVQQARDAARRNQAMNQLKQIGLAMHNHHDVFKQFPAAAICDDDGEPLLSWRVKILPYLGEDAAALYEEFHLDEPWDSEHNKPLLAKMPDIYQNPLFGDLGGKTVYLVPTGDEVMFAEEEGRNMKTVTDGMSNTILVIMVDPANAVPWTKPDDLEIDSDEPSAGLAHLTRGIYVMLAGDGSVHALSDDIDDDALWSLFTFGGGEQAAWPPSGN